MAMEKRLIIRDCHSRAVTAVAFVPWRREYVTAAEDGQMRYWEFDCGKLVQTVNEHGGWVTDIICWVEYKAMFTSSNDGTVIVWSSTGTVHQRIELNHPVYCLAWQLRRSQLIAGMNGSIRAYNLKEGSLTGAPYMEKRAQVLKTHTDIVKCIICIDAKVYSGGYDQRLVLHEALPGERELKASNIVKFAHDAGINCMTCAKDTENTWIITGAFDHIVKVWSPECKLIHRVTDQSFSVVTGICYVPRNKTVWVSSGNELVLIFEPKSGENVSEFISTFRELVRDKEKQTLMALKYVPEASEVVATTKRRQLVVWKHEQTAATVTLPSKKSFECLSYTSKPPILIFSGGGDGQLIKWEQQQLNNFAYSQEVFSLNETSMSDGAKVDDERERSRQSSRASDDRETDSSSGSEDDSDVSTTERSHSKQRSDHSATKQTAGVTMLRSTYIESLDNLVVGCVDGTIFIWGYDTKAKKALQGMSIAATDPELLKKYGCLLNASSDLLTDKPCSEKEDSVTDRVAGFICKHILKHHSGSVTGLAVVETSSLKHNSSSSSRLFSLADAKTYLLSGGWDRNVCLWDIEAGTLVDKVRYQKLTSDSDGDIASDGVITDMAYCSERNEFAYSSTDKLVYIRKFAKTGSEMKMVAVLQGHEGDVTQVEWNDIRQCWVTGSEDGTIRLWAADGMSCQAILVAGGVVSALCIDQRNGCVVAGVHDVMKVYDLLLYKLVQTNHGHKDAIRSIIHVPERNQYVSASWDKTLRIWNAYVKRGVSKESSLPPDAPTANGLDT